MESLWALVNFLQIVYYIPLINTFIPLNFYIFITEYLEFASLKLNIFPNPFNYLGFTSNDYVNDRFVECQMEDVMFLYNFGITLFLWVFICIFYIFLCFLDKILPKSRCLWVRRYKQEYKYNTIWRTLIETFLELNVTAMLNLFYVNYRNLFSNYIIYIAISKRHYTCYISTFGYYFFNNKYSINSYFSGYNSK